uniref:Uncharacterized protein n=1 Tax=Timema monikensis TaxID=170555 RepID=A0A7R9HMZ8_9NEOP|nr:unnamed protein product [Timema monikensis]
MLSQEVKRVLRIPSQLSPPTFKYLPEPLPTSDVGQADLEEKEASLLPPRFLGNPLECVTTQEGSDVILTLDIEPSGGAPTAISCSYV